MLTVIELIIESFVKDWRKCGGKKSLRPSILEKHWNFFSKHTLLLKLLTRCLHRRLSDLKNINHESLPDYLLLLELELIQGKYHQVLAASDKLSERFSKDLRLQDVRCRSHIAVQYKEGTSNYRSLALNPFKDYFCVEPFQKFTVSASGYVTVCCTNWIDSSIGSVYKHNFEEVWHSQAAQAIRASILDGSYRYCNKMACPHLRQRSLPKRDNSKLDAYTRDIIRTESVTSCTPRKIVLAEDPTCNLTCPSCRSGPVFAERDKLEHFEKEILPKLLTDNVMTLQVAGHGEPFASKHYWKVLRSLSAHKHPTLTLCIVTNAVLFNPKVWNALPNLHDLKVIVGLSIDGASKDTFESIRRGGDWSALLSNLAFLGELRAKKQLHLLNINFVVQRENYHEMEKMLRLAEQHHVDKVKFLNIHKTGDHFTDQDYKEKAVHLSSHAEYEKYRSIIASDALNSQRVEYS